MSLTPTTVTEHLLTGMRTFLPRLSEIAMATGIEAVKVPTLPAGILIYLAGEGETCWDVGKRFGIAPADVADWNPSVSEPFMEGQQLVLLRSPRK